MSKHTTLDKLRAIFGFLFAAAVLLVFSFSLLFGQEITPSNRGGKKTLAASAPFESLTVYDTNGNLVTLGRTSIINPASGDGAYRADPTGVTDSTAAIQAALDAPGTATVELPAGTFKVGTTGLPLFLPTGKTLRGQGRGTTTLKVSNDGQQFSIASWSCSNTIGDCITGTGTKTLTLNFNTAPFATLSTVDYFCSVGGGGCTLAQWIGFAWADSKQAFGVFGGGLTGVRFGGSPFFPGATGNAAVLTATTFTIQVGSGTFTANSGSGGTFLIPLKGAIFAGYDARNFTEQHDWEISNLTFDGSCNSCSTAASGWIGAGVFVGHKSQPAGGYVTNGVVRDVTFQNFALDAVDQLAVNGMQFLNITCSTVGSNCFGGLAAGNEKVTNLRAVNMGFPFQGNTGLFNSSGFVDQICCGGYSNVVLDTVYFQPNASANNWPFGLSFYQNGTSPDATHKLMHDVTVRNYTYIEGCQSNGGLVTAFVDNLLIDGVVSDPTACGSTSPVNGTGFIEIGGSNNRITNGVNAHVVWAGIDNVYTHASGIEVDHMRWTAPYSPFSIFTVSGGQGGNQTLCEIDNIDVHDNSGLFDLHQTSTVNGSLGLFVGLGAGEGTALCTLKQVNVHHNSIRNINGTSVLPALMLTGQGNGTFGGNDDWSFHDNRFFGFKYYMQPQCSDINGGFGGGGSAIGFNGATTWRIVGETSDTTTANVVRNQTGGTSPGLYACPNNWNSSEIFGANAFGGKMYGQTFYGVSGSITGVASSCVSGTVANASFLQGGLVRATRADGAAVLSGTSVKGNVAANGTATVQVCSGATLEPAGAYNVEVINPLPAL